MPKLESQLLPGDSLPSPPSVLVVDDEPAFCAVVCEVLQMFGFDTHQAMDAGTALELLANIKPDLILTDLMMPGLDGLHLIRRLRATPAWSRIPTIVVSALGSPEDRSAAEDAGADAFLIKPFSVDDLRRAVGRVLPGE